MKEKTADGKVDVRRIVWETVGFSFVILAVYGLVFFLFRHQLEAAGKWTVSHLGMGGVFGYVYLVDTFIVPATADLVFPLTFGWEPVSLLLVMSVASMAGGLTGFLIARRLSHLKFIRNAVSYYRERGEALISRYGAWAIVIAGLTPVPYSTVSWIAGMMKLPVKTYILASLSRIPRFFLYYGLIKAGIVLASRAGG